MQTKQHKNTEAELFLQFGLVVLSSLVFWIPRENYFILLSTISLLAFFYWKIWQQKLEVTPVMYVLIFSSAVFAPTNLSQDVYRFIWDGKLILNGFNPHDFRPKELINQGGFSAQNWHELYKGMGPLSQRNYSCYPFVTQIYSLLSALLPNFTLQVIGLKLLFVGTFLLTYQSLKRLLQFCQLPSFYRHLFWLNPLVLIEGLGNLHFEFVMLCFVSSGIYALTQLKYIQSSLFLTAAIQAKLIPLLILPFFVRVLGWKKSILFGLSILAFVFISSLVFIHPSNSANFFESIALYYGRFEFNSPIFAFYLDYGMWRYGFYPLENYARYLTTYAFLFLITVCFYRLKSDKSWSTLFSRIAGGMTVYYFFATTVHPWYLIFPLFFAVLSQNKLTIYWSFLVFFSYLLYDTELKEFDVYIKLAEYILLTIVSFQFVRTELREFWKNYLTQ